ncbi:MAG: CHAD domain-containing protein [Solirubrobacterales bacterium]|nr:CHAD domain-containing protein [Solirubrobacterales bacterium]
MSLRAIRIESGSGLSATFVPEAGMIGISLRHDGEELLGQRRGLEGYVESGKTMGLPILYPWANRLSKDEYEFEGRTVRVEPDAFGVRRDENGLAIHGTLAASPLWVVEDASAGNQLEAARLTASLDFAAHPELLASFPFPHRLELEMSIEGEALSVTATVVNTGDGPMPLAFGFHPYLTLPGGPRQGWRIELPARQALEFDQRGIPVEGSTSLKAGTEKLGDRSFDDGFTGIEAGAAFAVSDGRRRIVVRFDQGYSAAQIFAPAGEDLICFEPMKAPTDALVSGWDLPSVAPGDSDNSRFTISVGPGSGSEQSESRSYRFERVNPASEVRRVARGRVESALKSLRDSDPAARAESVHEARKDMKKVRAVLRLVRDDLGKETFRTENRRYRDAARILSDSRDSEVLVETLEALVESQPDIATGAGPLIIAFDQRRQRDRESGGTSIDSRLERAAQTIEEGSRLIDGWNLSESDWQLFAGGLRRTYRDGWRRLEEVEASATPEAVHEWRKRVKDLWYQLQLLRNSWKEGLKSPVKEVGHLAEMLGEYNDFSVLLDALDADHGADPATAGLKTLATLRQAEILEEALPLGQRIYAEKPRQFTDRIGSYWSV